MQVQRDNALRFDVLHHASSTCGRIAHAWSASNMPPFPLALCVACHVIFHSFSTFRMHASQVMHFVWAGIRTCVVPAWRLSEYADVIPQRIPALRRGFMLSCFHCAGVSFCLPRSARPAAQHVPCFHPDNLRAQAVQPAMHHACILTTSEHKHCSSSRAKLSFLLPQSVHRILHYIMPRAFILTNSKHDSADVWIIQIV